MQNLLDDLTELLQGDQAFISDGAILKNAVIEAALNMDARLLALLMQSPTIKAHFFTEVAGVLVFDKVKFQDFVSNKAFLPDSYTAFKNRIGLTDARGDYLSQSRDVVLAWPYKDCVLEGGMTKEDRGRNEVFWNTTLAPDDITRLFEPKVLTGWERWDAEAVAAGKPKPVGTVSQDDNLLIKGNNLLALHSLKARYAGKVKLIYIDPPYNTGDDGFKYNDRFNHSAWLTFMRNRLEAAKALLCRDGFLFVQCDDNEQAYLKVLLDEVFPNFLTTICVQMSYVSGEKMAHVDRKPPKIKEFIHIFTKHTDVRVVPQFTEGEIDSEYNKYLEKNGSENPNDWEVKGLAAVLKSKGIKNEDEKEDFILENADCIFNRVRNKTDAFTSTRGNQKLTKVVTPTGLEKWAWNGREVVWLSERIVKDAEGNDTYQQALGDIWSDIPIVNLYLEGGVDFPRGKKPEQLVRRMLAMATDPGDLVLDFFAGSGTTAAVAHKMGRRWIAVEQMDYIEDLPTQRFKYVIEGEQGGVSKAVEWQGGGSFVYAELAASNSAFVDRIEAAPDMAALQIIHADIQATGYLRYDVDLNAFDTGDFAALPLEDAKRVLMDCLDANHLYVNLGSLGDADFDISDEDARATRSFYGLDQ